MVTPRVDRPVAWTVAIGVLLLGIAAVTIGLRMLDTLPACPTEDSCAVDYHNGAVWINGNPDALQSDEGWVRVSR